METSALTDGQNSPAAAVSVWSEGGGMTRAWQHELPVKVEESVCSEPHLEVDSVVEPTTVAIQETGQT